MTEKLKIGDCPLSADAEKFLNQFPVLAEIKGQIHLDFQESMESTLNGEIDTVEQGTEIISAFFYCFVSAIVCTTSPVLGHTARTLQAKKNSEDFQKDIMSAGHKTNMTPSGLIL